MIFDIALIVVIFMNFVACWHGTAKQEKEVDDLRTKYHIAKEEIRDLKTRIRFLEMEEERRKRIQALSEAESDSYKI